MKVHQNLINNHAVVAKEPNFTRKSEESHLIPIFHNSLLELNRVGRRENQDERSFTPIRDVSPEGFRGNESNLGNVGASVVTEKKEVGVRVPDSIESERTVGGRILSAVTQKPLDEYQQ